MIDLPKVHFNKIREVCLLGCERERRIVFNMKHWLQCKQNTVVKRWDIRVFDIFLGFTKIDYENNWFENVWT